MIVQFKLRFWLNDIMSRVAVCNLIGTMPFLLGVAVRQVLQQASLQEHDWTTGISSAAQVLAMAGYFPFLFFAFPLGYLGPLGSLGCLHHQLSYGDFIAQGVCLVINAYFWGAIVDSIWNRRII